MTPQEANKIIAEYMGVPSQYINGVIWNAEKGYTTTDFRKSLDALVPVWEKLGIHEKYLYPKMVTLYHDELSDGCDAEGKTIQEAACTATAKAIKELK